MDRKSCTKTKNPTDYQLNTKEKGTTEYKKYKILPYYFIYTSFYMHVVDSVIFNLDDVHPSGD